MSGSRMGWCVAVLMLAFLSVGCSGGLKQQVGDLQKENQELRAERDNLKSALASAPDPSQLRAMQNEIAQREARINELESQLRKPEPGGRSDPGIAGIETSYDRKRGEMTVHLPSDILFASGSADLKASAKATLDKVAAALKKDYAGKKIRIEGHTDTDPIVKTKDKWTDNLGLSLGRAAAVTRYLSGKGLDKKNLATVGYGEAKPKANKAKSRRVEIVVVVG